MSSSVIAWLSPTNTGKTHRAIEEALSHETAVLGFPLRLLAREVYDKICAKVGSKFVALITGEEKIHPPGARIYICTTEAMPNDREFDFLCVDEIQLAAHPQRGHIFSDRLLYARGTKTTWFLGSPSIEELLLKTIPTATIRRATRLSRLSYTGQAKATSIPSRSAIVCFNTAELYRLAEWFRRRKGGVSVISGALSPATRNRQVELYQSGDVDYMVATDAIGMGLNLSLDHVALAKLHKFDGQRSRDLHIGEIAQIAGRAGRNQHDGSFGTIPPAGPLSHRVFTAIEQHKIPADRVLYYRNSQLDFRDLNHLVDSLKEPPSRSHFCRSTAMDDLEILERLKQDRAILERCNDSDTVKEFWKMCQIPDFRQLFPQAHAETIREIFLCWNDHGHAVPHDWIRKKLERLAHFSGDLEQLTARLAGVRIWNYLCNHSNWVSHAEEIVEEIRTTEERLSLSLHESLMQRFVPERSQQRYRRSYPIENTQNENTPSIDWKRVQGSSFNELHDSLQSQLDVHHATLELASKQINPAEFILRLDGDVYFRNNKIGMLVINQRSWNSSVIVHQADQKPDNAQCYKEHLTLWFEEQNAKYRSFMQYPTHDDPERALQYALLEGFGWADEKNLRHACPNALQKRLLKSFRVKRTLLGLIHLDWWKPGALAFRVALLNQRLGLSPLREEELRQALIHTNPERQDWLRALGFVPFGALALRLDLALALPELLMDINHRLSPQDTPSAISQHLSVSLDKLGLSRQDLLKLSQQRDSAIPRVLKKAVSKLLSLLR